MLRFPLNGNVLLRINAVLGKQVGKGILRRGALAAGIDGFPPQILHRVNRIPAFHKVQHPQGVDGKHLKFSLGVVVKHACQISGNGGNIQFTLNQLGSDLIGRGGNGKGKMGFGGRLLVRHQLDHTHGGRALQRRHIGGARIARGGGGRTGSRRGAFRRQGSGPGGGQSPGGSRTFRAAEQRETKQQGKCKRQKLFHRSSTFRLFRF